MKNWRNRLLIAFVIAWLLPFPGVHIGDYIPLIWTLVRVGFHDADAIAGGYYIVLGIAVVVYASVVFGILSVIAWARAPNREAESPKPHA